MMLLSTIKHQEKSVFYTNDITITHAHVLQISARVVFEKGCGYIRHTYKLTTKEIRTHALPLALIKSACIINRSTEVKRNASDNRFHETSLNKIVMCRIYSLS